MRAPEGELPVRSVCLITKDYPPNVPGGIPRAVQMQAQMLAAIGVRVHVITQSLTGIEGMRNDSGVIVHELPDPAPTLPPRLGYLEIALWSCAAASKFEQLDDAVHFDIVEAPDYRGEALHLAPRPGTALIVWLHSTMMTAWNSAADYIRNPSDDAWHALEMAALQRADLLLAPSQQMLDTTAQLLGERMRPVELIPYLFDATQFPVNLRQRRGGPIRALFYGRLESRKNPELAMRAVAAARADGLEIELTIVGANNGHYRERVLEPLRTELGLDCVSYQPHLDLERMRGVLADSDVAILPSRFDVGPMTVLESLSSGVPVITSNRVGASSWFSREDGLLALPIDDPVQFSQVAAAAMGDPEWMASGPRAATRMREKFSPEVVIRALLECYARLMAARGRSVHATVEVTTQASRTRDDVLRTRTAPVVEGARGHAVLAFADELVADPTLLSAWADAFDGDDDITLAIRTPSWSLEETQAQLAPLVAQAGLDGEEGAHLLALPAPPGSLTEARLAAECRAILTRRGAPPPFDGLLSVDERSIEWLRDDLAVQRMQAADPERL